MRTSQHCALGRSGETLACEELARRGYAILDRRYRTRAGEIDIICRDGDVLVFTEVKTRRSRRYGAPAEALTVAKRRQVAAMAADWLARHRVRPTRCRFDVVSICIDPDGRSQIEVIANAFLAGE
jgi:putative endonuclease